MPTDDQTDYRAIREGRYSISGTDSAPVLDQSPQATGLAKLIADRKKKQADAASPGPKPSPSPSPSPSPEAVGQKKGLDQVP
jgi:hypothetical protein